MNLHLSKRPVGIPLRRLSCLGLHLWLNELLVSGEDLLEHIAVEDARVVVNDGDLLLL